MNRKYYFMDKRIASINKRLSEFSLGRFDRRLEVSPALDTTDAVINGINMLGEELKAITISRDYFNRIFHSVSDMVLIVNSRGIIEDANRAAGEQLGYPAPGALKGKNIHLLQQRKHGFFRLLKKQLQLSGRATLNDAMLVSAGGMLLPVKITATHFNNERKRKLILLTASDRSIQVKTEALIIRAIIDTQEKERQRLAKDLHDGLTQQLSAIKLYMSSMGRTVRQRQQKEILEKCRQALAAVIVDMRNTCFNLMPRTLQEFGLVKAVQEFCSHFAYLPAVQFRIRQNRQLPPLPGSLSIDLYRVIQEFIANAIRHGKATLISIRFRYSAATLYVVLTDNGSGFNRATVTEGMGLQNVQSRVSSHQGILQIESMLLRGTSYKIMIPLNPVMNETGQTDQRNTVCAGN
jgi:PAS domain S-box-containing protein